MRRLLWDATLVKPTGIGHVRNEADIVATTAAYRLALGCDEILLVDNGSDNGTTEILHQLSEADPRFRWTRDNGPYLEAEIMTGLSRDAWVWGADWVLPFDADEFWWCRTGSLRSLLEGCRVGVLRAGVVNFVKVRGQRRFTPGAIWRMTPPSQKGSKGVSGPLVGWSPLGPGPCWRAVGAPSPGGEGFGF